MSDKKEKRAGGGGYHKRYLFTKKSTLIRKKLTNRKFDLKLKAKDKTGNRMRVKSTIMMRDTKITKISIMRMAITMNMDMMITITPMATTMNLNITRKKFIISTEIINQKDTREVEATR